MHLSTFALHLGMRYKTLFFYIGLILLLGGCTVVKPYQRTFLNDPEMETGLHSSQKMEQDVQTIREGASTPGGAKSSGGCGCN